MTSTLKEKAISGVKWNFIGQIGQYGTQFFVSIILARLLLPAEFGLVGMLTIFTAIASVFINSGLGKALVQKKESNDIDYSTVFFFNIAISFLFYLILFLSAGVISRFYNEPELYQLTRYSALVFVINAFGTVQSTILSKELNFKKQNLISIIGVVIAGTIAVIMAYLNYGVYSIIGQSIGFALVTNLLLWITSRWRPKFVFSWNSFKQLFGFGSKLLISSILDKIYTTLDSLIIGKVFSATQLGYFSRAKATRDLPINTTTGVLTSLVLPIFAKTNNDIELKNVHLKFLSIVSYIIFPLVIGIAVVAEPFTVILFSDKWLPSVPMLQILCLTGPAYPLSVILVNVILAKGQAGLFLKLDVYKKIVGVFGMLVGLYFGFYAFIIGFSIANIVGVIINFVYTGKLINVKMSEYLKILAPSFFLSCLMGILVYSLSFVIKNNYFIQISAQVLLGIVIFVVISHFLKLAEYVYLKNTLIDKLQNLLNAYKKS